MEKYIVEDKISILASKARVWKVLTNPDYIRQWDDIPSEYLGGNLKLGAILEWEGHAKMTVTILKEEEQLTFNLFLPKVELDAAEYNVNYSYYLEGSERETELKFVIGEFSPLPNPQQYYDATIEFVAFAKQKIKELSEAV